MELFRQKHNLPEDGEFYTAIGPDGKEIILRRYLNDQNSETVTKPGFLNVAMNHLKENTVTRPRHSKRRQPPPPSTSLDG